MLKTGYDIRGQIDRVRAYLIALGYEKRIKIAFDEWNLRAWFHPNLMDISRRSVQRYEDENFYKNKALFDVKLFLFTSKSANYFGITFFTTIY